MFSYGPVGQQHKLFDQFVCFFGNFEVDADRFSLFVDFKLHFATVEIDCSGSQSFLTQDLCETVQFQNFFFIVSFTGFNDILGFFVSETSVGTDYRMTDAVIFYFCFFVHIEDHRIGQFLFVRAEGADEVTQTFWKHRNGAVYQIYGSGTFGSFFINNASFLDIV